MLLVTVLERGGPPRRFEFSKDQITIGRTPDNDLPLPKGNVSKRQCRLTVNEDKQIELLDLKSTCGTYVNQKKVSASVYILRPDDKIHIGDFILVAEYQGDINERSKVPVIQFEPPPGPKLEGRSVFSPIQLSHSSVIRLWGDNEQIFAVGAKGSIFYGRREGAWARAETPTQQMLWGIFGSSTILYCVGEEGTVLHSHDGRQWRREEIGLAEDLFDLWCSPEGRFYAVGEGGIIICKDSERSPWRRLQSNTQEDLLGVFGDAKSLYAVGKAGVIVRADRSTERFATIPSDTDTVLLDVWSNERAVFVSGGEGLLLCSRDQGETFRRLESGVTENLWGIFGFRDRIFAVGKYGAVIRSEDGIHWKTLYSGTREWLVGIIGDGRGGVYISGEEGLLLHGPEL